MVTVLCVIAGVVGGIIAGHYLNYFVCVVCEINQIISWVSYICYGVPIISGIAAGIDSCSILPEGIFDIFGILELLWDIVKIILKVSFSAVIIALIALIVSVIIVFIDSGAIIVAVIVAAVVIGASTPVIRIVIEF